MNYGAMGVASNWRDWYFGLTGIENLFGGGVVFTDNNFGRKSFG
jgi:hypothetical protein